MRRAEPDDRLNLRLALDEDDRVGRHRVVRRLVTAMVLAHGRGLREALAEARGERGVLRGVEVLYPRAEPREDTCADERTEHRPSARRPALADEASGGRVAGVLQGPGARDEVGERVGLVRELAGVVPGASEFAAPADVRDGVHEPAVEQRQARDPEVGVDRDLVRAVAVEQTGGGAVERHVGAPHDRDGHRGAVVGGGPEPLGDVVLAAVGAERRMVEDRGLLQHPALTRVEAVFEHGRRRHH